MTFGPVSAAARVFGRPAQQSPVLFSFPNGMNPSGALLAESSGSFYGTTYNGGIGYGTAYRVSPPSKPSGDWTQRVLINFTNVNGANPDTGLSAGPGGALFGTTTAGGLLGSGTVFRLTPPPKGQYYWTETVLHNFSGKADGAIPYAGVLVDRSGNLYGTTVNGGTGCGTCGTAYELIPPAAGKTHWRLIVLHAFGAQNGDGIFPAGGFVMDASGNLYGTTAGGGVGSCGCGTVFELSPPPAGQTTWGEKVLYSFNGVPDGSLPYSSLTLDEAGSIYGNTDDGGTSNAGTVFELARPARGQQTWREHVLYSFAGQPDGVGPSGTLVRAADGDLYGTATVGGTSNDGTAFRLSRAANGKWAEKTLFSFSGTNGTYPSGGVVFGNDGSLYGVVSGGGYYNGGAFFKLAP